MLELNLKLKANLTGKEKILASGLSHSFLWHKKILLEHFQYLQNAMIIKIFFMNTWNHLIYLKKKKLGILNEVIFFIGSVTMKWIFHF